MLTYLLSRCAADRQRTNLHIPLFTPLKSSAHTQMWRDIRRGNTGDEIPDDIVAYHTTLHSDHSTTGCSESESGGKKSRYEACFRSRLIKRFVPCIDWKNQKHALIPVQCGSIYSSSLPQIHLTYISFRIWS